MFPGPYTRKNGVLVRCDEDSPFPDIDEQFAVDPIDELSGDINALMKGMSELHKANRILKGVTSISLVCNLYLLYKLDMLF